MRCLYRTNPGTIRLAPSPSSSSSMFERFHIFQSAGSPTTAPAVTITSPPTSWLESIAVAQPLQFDEPLPWSGAERSTIQPQTPVVDRVPVESVPEDSVVAPHSSAGGAGRRYGVLPARIPRGPEHDCGVLLEGVRRRRYFDSVLRPVRHAEGLNQVQPISTPRSAERMSTPRLGSDDRRRVRRSVRGRRRHARGPAQLPRSAPTCGPATARATAWTRRQECQYRPDLGKRAGGPPGDRTLNPRIRRAFRPRLVRGGRCPDLG